jgi:hypothetical protein
MSTRRIRCCLIEYFHGKRTDKFLEPELAALAAFVAEFGRDALWKRVEGEKLLVAAE